MTSENALRFLETQKELRPEQKVLLEKAVEYYREEARTAAAAIQNDTRKPSCSIRGW